MSSQAKRAERRIKQRLLNKLEEARQRGMTDENEISAWAVEQLAKDDPLFPIDLAIAFSGFPEEPDDDERTRELRAFCQHIVHLVNGALDQ